MCLTRHGIITVVRHSVISIGVVSAFLSSGLAACMPSGSDPSGAVVQVVATTTVFADLVSQVGGERVSVRSLVPSGGEPHTFDPRPSDVTAFKDADLVVMNGLGLDDWVVNLMSDAGSEAPVIVLAENLPGADYIAGGEAGGPTRTCGSTSPMPSATSTGLKRRYRRLTQQGPMAMRSVPMGTVPTCSSWTHRLVPSLLRSQNRGGASSRFMMHFPISQRRTGWRSLAPWSRHRARIRARAR